MTVTALDLLAERVRHLETLEVPDLRPLTWVIPNPAVGVVGQIYVPWDCTVVGVYGNVIGGTSCTFNAETRTTPGVAGTDILTADMVADADGESVTGGFNVAALAAGSYRAVDISAVDGAVDWLSVTLVVSI